MNESKKVLVFLDAEDLARVVAVVKWGAVFARMEENGDLKFFREDATTANGSADGRDAGNARLGTIINAGENVQVNVFSKKKGKFVPIDAKAENGVLDLRRLIAKPNKK